MSYEKILTALADPTRREIFERLRQAPQPVGKLAAGLPVSRPAVSQHLKALKQAGLVTETRQGTRRFYRVDPRGLEPLRRYLNDFWGDVLTSFQAEAENEQGDSNDEPGS
ncbi:MAG: metalloregulator ArsR/SmtB family transcription factor [Acidobacteriota bacterium]